jgi:hypothetical protein
MTELEWKFADSEKDDQSIVKNVEKDARVKQR